MGSCPPSNCCCYYSANKADKALSHLACTRALMDALEKSRLFIISLEALMRPVRILRSRLASAAR